MKISIQVVIEQSDQVIKETITSIEREELTADTLGLHISEAKRITSGIQQVMARYQVENYISSQNSCSHCKKKLLNRGYHALKYRTLFGKISLKSPRYLKCDCHEDKSKSFSPLTKLLPERVSPELLYLESKWASLMSYGMTSKLLSEVLPLQVHCASVEKNAKKVSKRIEKEIGEEHYMYIEGCPRDWKELPRPGMPLTVGIDGGYIHAREGNNRKAGWFEAIVGETWGKGKYPPVGGLLARG
jgi:hypothetical protein